MWSYQTPVGTFFIYYAAHACQLRINNAIQAANGDPNVLAAKVANFDTGYDEFDFLALDPNVQPPRKLDDWTRGKSF